MSDERGVRVRAVAAVAVVSALLCWLLLGVWSNTGHEPPELPWVGLVPLLLLSVAVLVAAWQVRRSVRVVAPGASQGERRRRIAPQRARGTLVAAQACALGGAALLGWYVANVLVNLPIADVPSVRALLVRALVCAAAALLLAISGLVAQAWCRIPPGADEEDAATDGGLAYG